MLRAHRVWRARTDAHTLVSPHTNHKNKHNNSYQLIFNYQRKYESGGLMWPFMVNRTLICCAIMVGFTGCVCCCGARVRARARVLPH